MLVNFCLLIFYLVLPRYFWLKYMIYQALTLLHYGLALSYINNVFLYNVLNKYTSHKKKTTHSLSPQTTHTQTYTDNKKPAELQVPIAAYILIFLLIMLKGSNF